MAAVTPVTLLSKSYSSDVTDEKGGVIDLPRGSGEFIFQIKVTDLTAGSITAKVEHSIDGVTWYDLVAFTAAIAANTNELKFPSTSVGGHIRSSVSTAAGSSLTAEIKVAYNPR